MDMINIFIILWIILIIILFYMEIEKSYIKKEGFTPKIRSMYHPFIRNFRINMESFVNNYNDYYFIKKLKSIGIY